MTWRLPDNQKQKYAAAKCLGLTSRLLENGWPGLSAKETGRIGAAIRKNRTDQQVPSP